MIYQGAFELHDIIGQGAMGQVWRGAHKATQLPVAIKVMTAEMARQPAQHQAFRNEVRAMARLDHPGIVRVFELGEIHPDAAQASSGLLTPGSPFLAMELLTGGTLENTRRWLPWTDLRALLLELLAALSHAHARGVIHRDLKPANILRDADTQALKITDFGIAFALDADTPTPHAEGLVSGTPRYMAPEQIMGTPRAQGPWTDLYALGAMAYELACGRPPYLDSGDALLQAHLFKPLPPLPTQASFPPDFPRWLQGTLAKKPTTRFQSAAHAAHALLQMPEAHQPTHTTPSGPPPSDPATDHSTFPDLLASRNATQPAPPTVRVSGPRDPLTPIASLDTGSGSIPPPPPRRSSASPLHTPKSLDQHFGHPSVPERWRDTTPPPATQRLHGAGLGLWGLRPVPLVNRDDERDHLWSDFAQVARTGWARGLLLSGRAGVGKSRLAQWLAERTEELGVARVLKVAHDPGEALDPIALLLTAALGAQHLDHAATLDHLQRNFFEALRNTGPAPTFQERQALAEIIAPAPPGTPTARFQSAEERFEVARRLLERLASQRPLLLWLDDLHWGLESLAFVRHLLDRPQLPLFIVGTLRDDLLAHPQHAAERLHLQAIQKHPALRTLHIGPLDDSHHAQLTQQLLGLTPELAHAVTTRTLGNPLFALQLVGALIQRGALHPTPHGFALRTGEPLDLPDSAYALWTQRLTTLHTAFGETALLALEMAAALGLHVERELWQHACARAKIPLPERLVDTLMSQGLARPDDSGWRFEHSLMRDALAQRARDASRWATHHLHIARTLQSRTHTPRGHHERLARHLLAAEAWDEALDPLLIAADAHRIIGSFPPAIALLDRYDYAAAHLDLDKSDPRFTRGRWMRARVLVFQGLVDQAEQILLPITPHAQGLLAARITALLGESALYRGDTQTALDALTRALEVLDAEAPLHERAELHHILASIHWWRHELELAQAQYTLILDFAETLDDDHFRGHAHKGLANIHGHHGRREQAIEAMTRALDCYAAAGSLISQGSAHNDLGELYRIQGDLHTAQEHYHTALELFSLAASQDVSTPRLNLALVCLVRGDFDGAAQLYTDELAWLEKAEQTMDRLWAHAGLLACAAAHNDPALWQQHFDAVTQLCATSGIADEDIPTCVEIAAEQAERHQRPTLARQAAQLAARLWRELDKPERAEALLQRLTPS